MSEMLKSNLMRVMPLMFHSDWNDIAWLQFIDSIKTGNTAFETAYSKNITDWLQENPQAAQIFNEANAAKAIGTHRAIVNVYDFSNFDTITDIGVVMVHSCWSCFLHIQK